MSMNRHERRKREKLGMDSTDAAAGIWWKQKVDPSDERFALISFRVPNGDMPFAEYTGAAALDRMLRWAVGILQGYKEADESKNAS